MRKPPGIRLRLHGRAAASVRRELLSALDPLRAQGVVADAFASVYEPEVHALGGIDTVPALHRWFTADSQGWWRWDRLVADGRRTIDTSVLTLAIVNDLCLRATGGATEEVWDIWRNLQPDRASADDGERDGERIPPLRLADLHAAFDLGAAEASLVNHYLACNERLAAALHRAWSRGHMELGLRALLVTAVMFHWNRYGLDPRTRARLCTAMDRAISPARA